jgi:hypothetical protein
VSERDLYAYSRVEQPLGCSETFKRGGVGGWVGWEGTNFIQQREKGKIIVGLGWRSGYVQEYASLARHKRTLSAVRSGDIK